MGRFAAITSIGRREPNLSGVSKMTRPPPAFLPSLALRAASTSPVNAWLLMIMQCSPRSSEKAVICSSRELS